MRFSLFGLRVVVSLPFTALLTFFFWIDRTGLATLSILTVLLHEAAHLLAMAACGVRPRELRLVVGAVEIVAPAGLCRRWQALVISFAGPAANLLTGAALYLLYLHGGEIMVCNAVILQVCFGLFNLLPAVGLDGGSILSTLCGEGKLARLPGMVSTVTLLLLTAGGAVLFFRYGGAGPLFAAVYLLATGLLCAGRGDLW